MAPRAIRTFCDFTAATAKRKSVSKLVRWLLVTCHFPEFRLVERYRAEAVQGTEALTTKAACHVDIAYYQRLADDTLLS
jgi:hypothetical protein